MYTATIRFLLCYTAATCLKSVRPFPLRSSGCRGGGSPSCACAPSRWMPHQYCTCHGVLLTRSSQVFQAVRPIPIITIARRQAIALSLPDATCRRPPHLLGPSSGTLPRERATTTDQQAWEARGVSVPMPVRTGASARPLASRYANASSSVLASWRSAVSKPSVNQP